jgi:hypothetical protein
MRELPKRGNPSPRYGHLGVWDLSKRSAQAGPGERLEVLILDETGAVIRRFEQIRGTCYDEGYVDFFMGPNCRPAKFLMPLVDIAPDGQVTELINDFNVRMGKELFFRILGGWVNRHGSPRYDLLNGVGPTIVGI